MIWVKQPLNALLSTYNFPEMSAFSPAVLGRLLAITVPAATVRRPCGAPGFHWLSPPAHRIHRLHSSKRTEATTITRYSYAPHALPAPVARASQTEPRFDRPHHCPACGQACYRPSVLHRHLQRCCPDLFREILTPPLSGDQLVTDRWLGAARSAEELQRQRALELTFKQRDASNTPVRRSADQVAEILGVGVDRAERLVKAAMRAVPMPADPDPVDVIFEDDDVVAVNKPAGIITAPKHRYVGGSMFNRVIHYLGGVEPAVVHRLDMNTTGVLLFAKSRDVVPALHKQFREKAARKEYLALVSGVPLWTELEVDAAIGKHKDIECVFLVMHRRSLLFELEVWSLILFLVHFGWMQGGSATLS